MKIAELASEKFRWLALVFLSLSLAIVIIDNTVLNVAIPYILRDLHTTFDAMQWVVSGYALIIATILITVGRLGDLYGRKRIFIFGTILFAIGSFIASISPSIQWLFVGEAVVEAIGAAMMLTSSLSLIVSEFQGKERSIAFGVWGSVAGASASLGPLLGGYLTTYYSWRWSLRINVLIAIIAVLGSVFIKEAKGNKNGAFDWFGTIFSGLGLFFLVFSFIEGRKYGWWVPNELFTLGGWSWPLANLSPIPYAFGLSVLFLTLFVWTEYLIEYNGGEPLVRLSLFRDWGYTIGLITLGIVVMGQFGAFFILPIYFQNVLGLSAFDTGLVFLWSSLSIAVFGPLSGFLATKFGPKWVVSTGMLASAIGTYWLSVIISTNSSTVSLGPALIIFGMGIGMASSQLTNVILSHVHPRYAGEASAVNSTFRQVGTSIGIALIGTVLASNLSTNIATNVQNDASIPSFIRPAIAQKVQNTNAESGQQSFASSLPKEPLCYPSLNGQECISPQQLGSEIKKNINQALVDASRNALQVGLIFIIIGGLFSLFIPNNKPIDWSDVRKQERKSAS